MSQLLLDIPEEAVLALGGSEHGAGNEVRLAAGAKLYELDRLSSGAAARLAGLPRAVFLSRLADYGVVSFSLTEEELAQETALA